MDDPIATAETIRGIYERWITRIADIEPPTLNEIRKAHLKHLEEMINDQLRFTRADTQGNVNTSPIKQLILEQAKLEARLENDKQTYEQKYQDANDQFFNDLSSAVPQSISLATSGNAPVQVGSILTPPQVYPSGGPGPDHLEREGQGQHSYLDNDNTRVDYGSSICHDTSHDHQLGTANCETHPTGTQRTTRSGLRRKASTTNLAMSPQAKRARRDEEPTSFVSLTPTRSIEFDELFQNGRATIKYKIVQFPRDEGGWYIMECKKCPRHFKTGDVITGAMYHMRAKGHLGSSISRKRAVQMFGTLVLNCNKQLAEMNNAVFEKYSSAACNNPTTSDTDFRPPQDVPSPSMNNMRMRQQKKKHYEWEAPKSYRDLDSEVRDPKPGKIYACWWPGRRSVFYPVMILPWGVFDEFNYKASLQDTGLCEDIPDCYDGAQEDDTSPRPWAAGYEDDGPLAHNRQVPVTFFNRLTFPTRCSVAWVPLSNLKKFDKDCPHTVRKEVVKKYLERKASHDKEEAEMTRKCTGPTASDISAGVDEQEIFGHRSVVSPDHVWVVIDSDSDEEAEKDFPNDHDRKVRLCQDGPDPTQIQGEEMNAHNQTGSQNTSKATENDIHSDNERNSGEKASSAHSVMDANSHLESKPPKRTPDQSIRRPTRQFQGSFSGILTPSGNSPVGNRGNRRSTRRTSNK